MHNLPRRLPLSADLRPFWFMTAWYALARGVVKVPVMNGCPAVRGSPTGQFPIAYPGLVRILTKSPVATRDIDLLTSRPWAEVGMTVTTADDKVSRWLEVRAPLATRLRTLTELREAGIATFAFVGPLLPANGSTRSWPAYWPSTDCGCASTRSSTTTTTTPCGRGWPVGRCVSREFSTP